MFQLVADLEVLLFHLFEISQVLVPEIARILAQLAHRAAELARHLWQTIRSENDRHQQKDGENFQDPNPEELHNASLSPRHKRHART